MDDRFYATVRCRLFHHTKLPWREIKTKNGLQALTKAKQRKEASAKSVRPAKPLQLFSQQGLYNSKKQAASPKVRTKRVQMVTPTSHSTS